METVPKVSIECINGYHEVCTDVVDHLAPERLRVACKCADPGCHTYHPF